MEVKAMVGGGVFGGINSNVHPLLLLSWGGGQKGGCQEWRPGQELGQPHSIFPLPGTPLLPEGLREALGYLLS